MAFIENGKQVKLNGKQVKLIYRDADCVYRTEFEIAPFMNTSSSHILHIECYSVETLDCGFKNKLSKDRTCLKYFTGFSLDFFIWETSCPPRLKI